MPSHLSSEEFFTSFSELLSKTSQKSQGSISITQKPLLHPTSSSEEKESSSSPYRPSILIRATDGNTNAAHPKTNNDGKSKSKAESKPKVKFSTVVSPDELEPFYTRYAEICKTGMSGLKKKQRKRKGKAKGAAGKVTKT